MTGSPRPGLLPWAEARRVAAVLRAARVASGKHQADVGKSLGWSAWKVSERERGLVRLTLAEALALGTAVGMSAADLGLEAAA